MPKIRDAAIELYQARVERIGANKALRDYREQHGSCENEDQNGKTTPCFYLKPDQNEWCDVCLGSQSFFEKKMKAARRCGAAIRKIMFLCKPA